MSKIRLGVLGLTHDHVWSLMDEARSTPGVDLVAATDAHRPLLERAEKEFGCTTYREPAALLERAKVDGVIVCADNATGVELTEIAAERGVHVLVEKPMAADLAGADRMLAAARRASIRLMINWPFVWWPQLQHALHLATSGAIGDLWQVKYRSAHEGPRELGCSEYFCDWLYDPGRNGAGALMDYCCYGAALARTLLGVPSRVVGVTGRLCKEDILVEDNGVIVMSYPRAIAISEGSWTQIGSPTAYVTSIYGTRGQLLVEPRPGGRLIMATVEQPEGVAIDVPEPIASRRGAIPHFQAAIVAGEPILPLCDPRVGRDAQEILEAGLLSASSGGEVTLPLKDRF